MAAFARLLKEIRSCRACREHLPLGPRPVLSVHPAARILLVGQAPGRRVHESGVAWDDASGDRLRDWLGVDRECFHDPRRFALVPMGFCYPGTGASGDLPPRPECAPLWHGPLLDALGEIRLTLLVGRHAQERYLGERAGRTLTATVRNWREFGATRLPLPHPSPRNNRWLAKNAWFEREVLPVLRRRVRRALAR